MTVKRQRLLTLFLTLQKGSTLIWKWEQPAHGKEGQKAKRKARRSQWRARSDGGSGLWHLLLEVLKVWASRLLINFVFFSKGECREKYKTANLSRLGKRPCFLLIETDRANKIYSLLASFIFDEESISLTFLFPSQWLIHLIYERICHILSNFSMPSTNVGIKPSFFRCDVWEEKKLAWNKPVKSDELDLNPDLLTSEILPYPPDKSALRTLGFVQDLT